MRVLITGGSGTIGSALVREFASDYEVIFTYLNNEAAARTLAELTGACAVRCDVRDRGRIKEITEGLSFDLLINNAGIAYYNLLSDTGIDDWERVIAVNLTGAFNVTQIILSSMLRRGSGIIVNVSSFWGEIGASCEAAYSAAKAGLIGFSKALAKEVEPAGVRVHYIAPGAVRTPMNNDFTDDELLGACPNGRVEKPEAIAKQIRRITGAY